MNTFSFLIAFSAVLCGAFAVPPYMPSHWGGKTVEISASPAKATAWEEPSHGHGHHGGNDGLMGHNMGHNMGHGDMGHHDMGHNMGGHGGMGGIGGHGGMGGYGGMGHSDSDSPCNQRGEVIIHRPAPIIVKRPPTKVLVNHPPLVVKPAPVVLHRPAPVVMKKVIVKQLPQQVKVEPVYVKVMGKPTHEKVYLDDSHRHGGHSDGGYGSYGHSDIISSHHGHGH